MWLYMSCIYVSQKQLFWRFMCSERDLFCPYLNSTYTFFIILNLVYNPPGASTKSYFGFLTVEGPHFSLAGEKELKLHFICESKYIFNVVFLCNAAPE